MNYPKSKHIQAVFGQGPSFVEADNIQFSANIDPGAGQMESEMPTHLDAGSPLWTDAEDFFLLQPRKSEIGSYGEGCG